MLSAAKPAACLLFVISALAAFQASAQQAAPADRCTGTLCDFYYGGAPSETPPPPAKAGAPTPLVAPTGGGILGFFAPSAPTAPGAPAPPSRIQVQGGGLVGLATGAPPDRCTGTLCDLYYGGPPPETPAQPAAAAAPQLAPADANGDDPTQQTSRHAVELRETHEPALCAASGKDPWACYRH